MPRRIPIAHGRVTPQVSRCALAMLRRLLPILLPILAASCSDHSKPSGEVHMADPKDILFSLPTLCDPAPAVDPTPPSAGHRTLHEDDWRQIEFVTHTNLEHIRKELASLIAFKQEHRRGPGWTQVYMRSEHPAALSTAVLRFSSLPSLPASALTIGSGPPWGGTVVGGFALTDAGDWFIYGQRSDDGHIIQLAVSPGRSIASEKFASALSEIAKGADLLLVDWYASSLVDTSTPASVLAWARRYNPD